MKSFLSFSNNKMLLLETFFQFFEDPKNLLLLLLWLHILGLRGTRLYHVRKAEVHQFYMDKEISEL